MSPGTKYQSTLYKINHQILNLLFSFLFKQKFNFRRFFLRKLKLRFIVLLHLDCEIINCLFGIRITFFSSFETKITVFFPHKITFFFLFPTYIDVRNKQKNINNLFFLLFVFNFEQKNILFF